MDGIIIETLAAWDLIVTRTGAALLVVPPKGRPRRLIAAPDGIYLRTDFGRMRLHRSQAAARILSRRTHALVIEAADLPVRETLIEVTAVERPLADEECDEPQRKAG